MGSRKLAGKALHDFLEWIGRAASVTSREEANRLDSEFSSSLLDEEIRGWKRGSRRISDMRAAQIDSQGRPDWIGQEIFAEDVESGVRISVFYDTSGKMMGRAYFDRGDVSARQVAKNLTLWQTIVRTGRPRDTTSLPISDAEIFDKLEKRRVWYRHSEVDGAEYKPTVNDAAEQLVEELELSNDPDSPAFARSADEILRAYDRERHRRRKK